MAMQNYRILARELAVEEIEEVSGAVYQGMGTSGVADSFSDQIGETGSGCTTPDDSMFTIYDDREVTEMQ